MVDSLHNLNSTAIKCFHTKKNRKKMVHGIYSINQRQFARIPVIFLLVTCVKAMYTIYRIPSIMPEDPRYTTPFHIGRKGRQVLHVT